MFVTKDRVREPLYAIVPYYNPFRVKAREKHTERSVKHFADAGAVVVLVEVAFNRRAFTFADSGLDGTPASCGILGTDPAFRHRYIGLRTRDELWLKENAINVAVGRVSEWTYRWPQLCWLDADVHFLRPNWVGEAIQLLQHYAFLQMFSHARDLAPDYAMLPEDYHHADGVSFVGAYESGQLPFLMQATEGYGGASPDGGPGLKAPRVWPGLAWACTREAWDAVGGLFDLAIWGGGDWHMAHALVGSPREGVMLRHDLHWNYRERVHAWADRAERHIRRNVGQMTGSIVHHWHGKKATRGYNAKHALLAEAQFDPVRHLKRDSQGLWQLHDDGSESFVVLRDAFRRIARDRNEDGTEV